jgi:thioredoxin 1
LKSVKIQLFLVLLLLLILVPVGCAKTSDSIAQTGQSEANLTSITLPQALTNGKPTLAEFGRGTCIPCKEMKPILENLAVEFQDRLNVSIVSVDVYRDLTNYYRIMAIPTQIVFDSKGKEIFRHVGLWPKDQIIAQLDKLGIK